MIYTGVSNQYLDTKIFLEAENKANIVSQMWEQRINSEV